MGLHKRYADLLGSKLPSVTLANSSEDNYRIQAREWASILSDPEARAMAEEAGELLLRKGFELPELVEKDLGKKRAGGITLAQYKSGVFPRIEVNINKDVKKRGGFKQLSAEGAEWGWTSQPNTILHELAHHMDAVMRENYRQTKAGDLFDKLDEKQVKKILSGYGATEAVEFRAELYSAILAGKTFPKGFLEAAYLTTYPDDRVQMLYQMGSGKIPNISMLEREFGNMMEALFTEDGASLRIDILAKDEVQGFIQSHADILGTSLATAEMSELMRSRLEESNYIFSGIKAFHELNEAFPSLLDEEGKRKPFEQFLNDVQSIDKTYNKNYLNAEYNFAQASAEMAGKWEQFTEDGDDYLLQYRTANDSKVRPEHAELHGVTLPMGDSFWDEYYPPNGWNCRCTVVQVLRSKYEQTPHAEAMQRAEQALQQDKKGMFHFNPGKTGKSFPDYNPYTLRRCNSCDVAKGELELAYQFANDNQLCQACQFLRRMRGEEPFRRLDGNERKQIHDSALAWADRHLPKVPMPDGTEGARLTVKTADGYELHIGKKFFNETFSKCKNSRRVAKTMEIATHIDEWIKDAIHVDTEPGKHHKFDFEVFRSNYNGQEIEFKAKVTEGLIVYLMRLL